MNLKMRISKDLSLCRFSNESITKFNERLLYSALVEWGKVLVYGESYSSVMNMERNNEFVHYNHVHYHLSKIAENLILSLGIANELHSENLKATASQLASDVLQDLIFSKVLIKPERLQLSASPKYEVQFNDKLLLFGYDYWTGLKPGTFSVGTGIWIESHIKQSNCKKSFGIPSMPAKKYIENIVENICWSEVELKNRYNVYSYGKHDLIYLSWIELDVNILIPGVYVIQSIENRYEYSLIEKTKDALYFTKLNEWYTNEKEVYRLIYALSELNNQQISFKAKVSEDYVILYCHSQLPHAEQRILKLLSWPLDVFDKHYNRVIPKLFWLEVKMLLTGLGIVVNEEFIGGRK